jgi:hypothetical protein
VSPVHPANTSHPTVGFEDRVSYLFSLNATELTVNLGVSTLRLSFGHWLHRLGKANGTLFFQMPHQVDHMLWLRFGRTYPVTTHLEAMLHTENSHLAFGQFVNHVAIPVMTILNIFSDHRLHWAVVSANPRGTCQLVYRRRFVVGMGCQAISKFFFFFADTPDSQVLASAIAPLLAVKLPKSPLAFEGKFLLQIRNRMSTMGDLVQLLESCRFEFVPFTPAPQKILTDAAFVRAFPYPADWRGGFRETPPVLRITISGSLPVYALEGSGESANRINEILADFSGESVALCQIESVRGVVRLMDAYMPVHVNLVMLALEVMRLARENQKRKFPIKALCQAMGTARVVDMDWGYVDCPFGERSLSVKFHGASLQESEFALRTPDGWKNVVGGDIGRILEGFGG